MARRTMWMGPRGGETWVKVNASGDDASGIGYSDASKLLNGGADSRDSVTSHMEYTLSWGEGSTADEMRPIVDMASGKRGPGLIYFLHPMSLTTNVLPEQWSMPFQGAYDAPPLFGDVRPTLTDTPANGFDYPAESAIYDLSAGTSRELYVPIPTGYTLWLGAHGVTDGTGGLSVLPVNGKTAAGVASTPTLLDVNTSTRFNASFTGVGGVVLSIDKGTSTTLTLSGVMAQVLPNGAAPSGGDFISGQGNSGCVMGKPQRTPYSSIRSQIGMTTKLVEVGDWR